MEKPLRNKALGNQEGGGRIYDMFVRKMGCEVDESSSVLGR